MRKTFIVTVDIDPELEVIFEDATAESAIASSLNENPFLHCHSVTLAPDSIQPINTKGNN